MNFFTAHDCMEYKDINGKTPEILMFDGNRSAGKTTAFIRKMITDYKEKGMKFMYLFRFRNEVSNPSETIFKDVQGLFFPEDTMTHSSFLDGLCYRLFLNGEECGYAVPLNLAFKLKRFSHYFSDVEQIFFDEYQTEEMYCPKEIEKFQTLHSSVARGQGKAVRFVPVYMCSNSVSIFNPYYEALGITGRIKSDTKILRGDGFVLSRVVMQDVKKEQENSPFIRAFGSSDVNKSSIDNSFLNDDNFNVCRMDTNKMFCIFVFRYKGKIYSCMTENDRLYFVKPGGDSSYYNRFGVTMKDRADGFLPFSMCREKTLCRSAYEQATTFFSDIETKTAYLELLMS